MYKSILPLSLQKMKPFPLQQHGRNGGAQVTYESQVDDNNNELTEV